MKFLTFSANRLSKLLMAWTFLYAASHQVFVPNWTIVGFLNHTKTFHDFFAIFTTPTMMRQNQAFQPFSPFATMFTNAGNTVQGPIPALPASSLNGSINTFLSNNVVTTQITPELKSKLIYRYYDFANHTPELLFPDWTLTDVKSANVTTPAYAPVRSMSRATAQLAVGPMPITSSINGIPVTLSVTSWISVNSVGDEITVDARLFADLIDLQKKFSDIVASFKRSAGDCNRSADGQNPVVSFKSGSLWPRSDQFLIFVRGDIDIWSCTAGRPQSAVRWEKKKIAFLTLNLPVRRTWRNVRKNINGYESFHVRFRG